MIVIQAHSHSTRLPGKIYKLISGKSVLEWCYESCREVHDQVWILGTVSDKQLQDFCSSKYLPLYCAPVDDRDVLGRYASFVRCVKPAWICRVTSDCPCIDPAVLSYVLLHSRGVDFASNCFPPRRIVDGNDVEVASARFVDYLDALVNQIEYREHVFSYVYDHIDAIKKDYRVMRVQSMLDWSDLKTSIDTEEDLIRVTQRFAGKS